MAASSSSPGIAPASESLLALTIIMNRTSRLLPLSGSKPGPARFERIRSWRLLRRRTVCTGSGDFRLLLHWEEPEVGLRFLEHPREGRARHQAAKVSRQPALRLIERNHRVRIEECRRGRAVGQGENVA